MRRLTLVRDELDAGGQEGNEFVVKGPRLVHALKGASDGDNTGPGGAGALVAKGIACRGVRSHNLGDAGELLEFLNRAVGWWLVASRAVEERRVTYRRTCPRIRIRGLAMVKMILNKRESWNHSSPCRNAGSSRILLYFYLYCIARGKWDSPTPIVIDIALWLSRWRLITFATLNLTVPITG